MQRRVSHSRNANLLLRQRRRHELLMPNGVQSAQNEKSPIVVKATSPSRGLQPAEQSPPIPQHPLNKPVHTRLFRSFFGAGFECSTHIRRSGYRLDLVHATAHDRFAREDYARLKDQGICVAREGVRWHLVERTAGKYDFSSVLPIVEAARESRIQVIWDLCHFGWPDNLDLFSSEFIVRLARYGEAFVQWLTEQSEDIPFIVPINEISYFSWASGDEGSMYPFITGRGLELKKHLVSATIATIKSVRSVAPRTRFVQVDPVIHVIASEKHPEEAADAEAYRESQYQAWDMLRGRLCPELGGGEQFLDVVGVNYYPHNQWIFNLKNHLQIRKFKPVHRSDPRYRPFSEILHEVYARYQKPVFIAETGAETRRRAGWFRYVCEQAQLALADGVPLQGICLYPILNHPGWVDDRHCHNALWDYPDESGRREIYIPLERELARWRNVFEPNASPHAASTQLDGSHPTPPHKDTS